jgi:GAF domain-containing protein/HAMP domain-containing protein
MNRTDTQRDTSAAIEHLAGTFYTNGRYVPIFLFVSGIGILVIHLLNNKGNLGDQAPQLLWIGVAITLLSIFHQLVTISLARRQHGVTAYLVGTASIAVTAAILTGLWDGFIYIAIPLTILLPAVGLFARMPRKAIPWLTLLTLVCILGIIAVENRVNSLIEINRLAMESPVGIASLAFLGAAGLLLVTVTIISQNRNFRSLQGLLLTSFVMIVTIPTVMAAVLSGAGAYSNSQRQTFNTLKAISSLKEAQISLLIDETKNGLDKIQGDIRFKQNIIPVLTTMESDPEQTASYRALARASILSAQKDKGTYAEIMILNTKGIVVLSTDFDHTGLSFEEQLFFRQGTVKFFTGFADVADFGNQNFVAATPLFDTNGQVIRGVIVLRSDANSIKRIMETTPGYEEAETYLVDKNYRPVTNIRSAAETVRTKGTLDAILENIDGQATYKNHAGLDVLGYYRWYEPMQMAIIAEVPVESVVRTSLGSLLGSSLLALLVILIAIATVVVAARSIADPIKELADVTGSYAAGKFHVRAHVDRKDEIGALGSAYNQMATELQEIIGKLEQRVTDRTRELESQTLRVRVAAEIARDAASIRDLNELLESSARLLLERFKFYHTGIFLIDKNREFAILAASPTEAGKKMIADGYKLRVGESGTVGRVASTGESRISLDTGQDAIHLNNPLLPETQSEMALPLKVGNLVIGVLDVQSEQSKAFTQDDAAILQVMADQLATAIERTRLLQEVEYNLKELEKAYGQYTREGWQRINSNGQLINRGYRFDNIRMEPLQQSPEAGLTVPDSNSSGSSNGDKTRNTIAIPIKLRGQTIGVITAKLKEGYNPRTVSTLEAATERLAAALESARLYEEARARADREQSIAQVTTKISASTEFETILRTTVEEIGKSIGNSEVSIQIVSDLNDQESKA